MKYAFNAECNLKGVRKLILQQQMHFLIPYVSYTYTLVPQCNNFVLSLTHILA